MTKHNLKSVLRKDLGRSVKKLRAAGVVPANVFGNDVKSLTIQVGDKELGHLIKEAGESTLIYLSVEGEKEDRPVMISELRRHPVTNQFQHVAFHQVNLKQKVTTAVPIELMGESPAVAEKLGILVQLLNEVELEALPTDMPEKVEVDVSALAEVDSAVYVKDIKVGKDIEIKSDVESMVAKVEPLAAEEVVEAPAPAEGEVVPVEGEVAEGEAEKPAEGEPKAEEKKAE